MAREAEEHVEDVPVVPDAEEWDVQPESDLDAPASADVPVVDADDKY